MSRAAYSYKTIAYVLTVLCLFAAMACEGTESGNKVGHTVERLSGKEAVKQMDEMKADIDKINQMQAERLKQIE